MTTELSFLLSFGARSKFLKQICSGPFSVAISNWPSFVGSKSFHSSHDSATSSKVSGVRQLQLQLQLYSFTFNLQLHDSFHPRIGEPNRGGGRDTQI